MIEVWPIAHDRSEAGAISTPWVERVREGVEIVIERDPPASCGHQDSRGAGRSIDEAIAIAEAFEAKLGYSPVPDPDFAKDVNKKPLMHIAEPLDRRTGISLDSSVLIAAERSHATRHRVLREIRVVTPGY